MFVVIWKKRFLQGWHKGRVVVGCWPTKRVLSSVNRSSCELIGILLCQLLEPSKNEHSSGSNDGALRAQSCYQYSRSKYMRKEVRARYYGTARLKPRQRGWFSRGFGWVVAFAKRPTYKSRRGVSYPCATLRVYEGAPETNQQHCLFHLNSRQLTFPTNNSNHSTISGTNI